MKQKVQAWSKKMAQARKKRKPPSAPSKSEKLAYDHFLKKALKGKRQPKVMILGVTPELRDIALKNNCEVISVDISKEMIKTMKGLVKNKKHKKDIILNDNWLTVPFKNNSFDVVMGDGPFTNIPSLPDVKKMLTKITKILKPDGYLLIREVIHLSNRKKSFKKVVSDYRKKRIKWEDFYVDIRFYVFFEKVYNSQKKLLYSGKVFKELIDQQQKGNLTEKELKTLKSLESNIKNLILGKAEFKRLFSKYFSFVSERVGKEFEFCKSLPIFLFKNKKVDF